MLSKEKHVKILRSCEIAVRTYFKANLKSPVSGLHDLVKRSRQFPCIVDFLLYRVILIHTLRYQVTLLLAEVMILKESSPQFRKFTSSTVHDLEANFQNFVLIFA